MHNACTGRMRVVRAWAEGYRRGAAYSAAFAIGLFGWVVQLA